MFGNRFGSKFSTRRTTGGLGAGPSGYFGATPISLPGRLRDKATQKPRRVTDPGPNPLKQFIPISMQPRSRRETPWRKSSPTLRVAKGSAQALPGIQSKMVRGY